jgi:hypothetical protein
VTRAEQLTDIDTAITALEEEIVASSTRPAPAHAHLSPWRRRLTRSLFGSRAATGEQADKARRTDRASLDRHKTRGSLADDAVVSPDDDYRFC